MYNQVDLLYFIASWRSTFLDPFFLFLNYFDSIYFVMAFLSFIWVSVSPRAGLHCAILVIINVLLNHQLKLFFHLPRPIESFPNLAMIHFDSFGFPSGAAQMTVLVGGWVMYTWRKLSVYIASLIYILLISVSRLYLGVHYPTDLLGGWFFGLIILFSYIYSIQYIEKFCSEHKREYLFALCFLCCALGIFLFSNDHNMVALLASMFGFGVGTYLSAYFKICFIHHLSRFKSLLTGIIGVVLIFVLYFALLKYFSEPLRAFLLAVWISLGSFPICQKIVKGLTKMLS